MHIRNKWQLSNPQTKAGSRREAWCQINILQFFFSNSNFIKKNVNTQEYSFLLI